MRALLVLLRLLPALAAAVRSGDQVRLTAVHDRADRMLSRVTPLPEAPAQALFEVYAAVRAITGGGA